MITLTRARTLAAVNAKFRGQKKKDQDLILLNDQKSILNGVLDSHDFKSTYWKTAKDQLKKESANKCAYCEAYTPVVAHGDVEHYRPKDQYWWLAYTYDNYLFACQICNQSYKNNNFPIAGKAFPKPAVTKASTAAKISSLVGKITPDPLDINNGYTLKKYESNHVKEKALLLNPYFDDPALHFAWKVDQVKNEITLIPANTKVITKKIVQACIDFYGLNRQELLDLRYNEFQKFRLFKKALNEGSLSAALAKETKDVIDKMRDSKSMFAGMIRYFDSLPLESLG